MNDYRDSDCLLETGITFLLADRVRPGYLDIIRHLDGLRVDF
jgi:hypothetical protein